MASEVWKKITGGSGSNNTINVSAGFDSGFIFNNDTTEIVTLTFADGSTYAIAPNEVYHFPYNNTGYDAIVFSSSGSLKYSFTNISLNEISKS